MTLGALVSIPYLAKEIELYDSRLHSLDAEKRKAVEMGYSCPEYEAGVREYRQALTDNRDLRKQELSELMTFIESISDPFMRAVFTARCLESKSWWDVAFGLEKFGTYNATSVRQAFYRYLRKRGIDTSSADGNTGAAAAAATHAD